MKKQYEIQEVRTKEGLNYRITHIQTDSRIATCYLKENADLVLRALNSLSESHSIAMPKTCFDADYVKEKQEKCPHPNVTTLGGVDVCTYCQKTFS